MNSDRSQAIFIPDRVEMPYSYDPLEADRHANLPMARMLFATPIEVSVENKLVSQVLESFIYNPQSARMVWQVKSAIKFSDGQAVSANDVAFAVSRMLFTRPGFPVISQIEGVEAWLKMPNPLATFPSGIKVAGSQIEIQFKTNIANPFFRFTLELFSIIPRQCVDLKSNRLICDRVPSSGIYFEESRTASDILFRKYKSSRESHGFEAPSEVRFHYQPTSAVASSPDGSVVFANEYNFRTRGQNPEAANFKVKWAPAADYVAMLISPKVKPFDNPKCRAIFAEGFRNRMVADTGSEGIEPSLFTKILPGYLPESELISTVAKKDREECLGYMRAHPIPWVRLAESENYFIDNLTMKTATDLGVPLAVPTIIDGESWDADFNTGRTAFYPFMSGFWALDPVGDVRMLFTPHLHPDLEVIWRDPVLQSLLRELENATEGDGVRLQMTAINKYLASQAVFNPIMHFRKAYISRDPRLLNHIPLAVQQPYPWQVFSRVE